LHTVYLDTAEFTLARHGVALRLRRNRTRWEASIKWSGRKDGTIHARPELSVPLRRPPVFPFVLLPGSLADQLSELVAGQLLTPILISDVRRQRRAVWVVGQSKAPAFAELALDQVRLSTSDVHRRTAETYYEIEVELEAGGTIADLRNFTELLQERFALTPSDGGKFHRGLALFYGPGLIGSARQRPGARKKTSPPTTQQ
jgi:inorganic triphosphatase YgiF